MERRDHDERSREGAPARSLWQITEQCGLTGARMVPRREWRGRGGCSGALRGWNWAKARRRRLTSLASSWRWWGHVPPLRLAQRGGKEENESRDKLTTSWRSCRTPWPSRWTRAGVWLAKWRAGPEPGRPLHLPLHLHSDKWLRARWTGTNNKW
jgi:hypothetical protein